jgi:hypothetical protein
LNNQAAAGVSVPTPSAATRITWEYKFEDGADESNANALGKEGWELVNVYIETTQSGRGDRQRYQERKKTVYKRPVDANAVQATEQTNTLRRNPGTGLFEPVDQFDAPLNGPAEPAPPSAPAPEPVPGNLDEGPTPQIK